MIMNLKAVILDDERRGREVLIQSLEAECPEVEVAGMFSSIAETVAALKEDKVDILFLDLKLGVDFGLDILPLLPGAPPHIIIITAHGEFAIKAFKTDAVDYLLKPIIGEELKAAVAKVRILCQESTASKETTSLISREKRITVPSIDGLIFVNTQDVIRCEASGSYTTIFLKTKEQIVISVNIGEVEEMLPEYLGFFRVHHSSLVNVYEVEKYVKNDGGYVVLSDKSRVAVSQRKKSRFLDLIKVPS